MSELLSTESPQYIKPSWFASRDGFTFDGLTHDFDRVSKTSDLDELYRIANLLQIAHENSPFNLATITSRYKCMSLPRYEQLFALQQGYQPGEQLGSRLDDMYENTVNLLETTLEHRNKISPPEASSSQLHQRAELTGACSELTIAALLNRNGQYANFITIPATKKENEGKITLNARRDAYDYVLYSNDNPNIAIKAQIKTSQRGDGAYKLPYESDILVVILGELVANNFDHTPALVTKLQAALIHEVRGHANQGELRLIGAATMKLSKKIFDHQFEVLHKKY